MTPQEAALSERARAITLANGWLDDASADPDDDLRIVARQFLRCIDPSESAPDPGLLREAARVVESLLIAPHYLGPSEFQEHRKGWNAAIDSVLEVLVRDVPVRAALSATPEQAGSGLAELLDELSEAWTSVERAIWPEGPAHGTGSGAYARLKARIIAALAAAPVAEPLDVERLARALDLCGIGLAEGGRPASEWAEVIAAEYAALLPTQASDSPEKP